MPLIGEATVRIGADDSKLRRGLDSAGKYTAGKFKAIGVAAAGAFAAAFSLEKLKELIESGKNLKVFADQAEVSAEAFQKFNFAIEKANGDASDTVSIMLDLKRAMADARTGKKEWVDRFALFGVTMQQIKKDDPVGLFMSIGKAVARTTELTGEQVDALGKMMGEDTSARAIAAFRNNFEDTMKSVILLTEEEVQALYDVDAAFKAIGKGATNDLQKAIAASKDDILFIATELRKTFEAGTEFLIFAAKAAKKGGEIANRISGSISSGASFSSGSGMNADMIRNLTAVSEMSNTDRRRNEVRGMFRAAEFTPDNLRRNEIRDMFKKAEEVLKQIRDKTGSGASTDIAVMGGL